MCVRWTRTFSLWSYSAAFSTVNKIRHFLHLYFCLLSALLAAQGIMGIFFLRFTRFASRAPQRIRTRIRTSRTDDQNAHMSRFDELLYSSGERTRAFIAPYRSRDLPCTSLCPTPCHHHSFGMAHYSNLLRHTIPSAICLRPLATTGPPHNSISTPWPSPCYPGTQAPQSYCPPGGQKTGVIRCYYSRF